MQRKRRVVKKKKAKKSEGNMLCMRIVKNTISHYLPR